MVVKMNIKVKCRCCDKTFIRTFKEKLCQKCWERSHNTLRGIKFSEKMRGITLNNNILFERINNLNLQNKSINFLLK